MDFLVLVVDEGHRALHLVFKLLQMVMAHQSYKKNSINRIMFKEKCSLHQKSSLQGPRQDRED